MKAIVKISIAIVSAVVVAALAFWGIFSWLNSNNASTPEAIAKKLHVKLPAYEIVESSSNMDRTASSWSDYCFTIRFTEPLKPEYLNSLERMQTYNRSDGEYHLKDEITDEWYASISFSPEDNTARIEYSYHDYLF
jgi:hypothetical protein